MSLREQIRRRLAFLDDNPETAKRVYREFAWSQFCPCHRRVTAATVSYLEIRRRRRR